MEIRFRFRVLEKFLGEQRFDACYIVNNAATVGDLTRRADELSDERDWHEYLQTNLVSTIRLNNQIYSLLKERVRLSG